MAKRRNKRGNNRDERASFIVDMFREFPDTKFSLKHLAAASGGADRDGRTMTFAIVRQLIEDGYVEEVSRSKYRLSRSALPRYEATVVSATPSTLYAHVEGLDSDIFIARRNARGALDGDRISLVVARKSRDGELEGSVVEVLERSKRPYVGTAQVTTNSIFVTPDSRRLGTDIYLPRKLYPEVEENDKLSVRVVAWPEGERLPHGELIERLGKAGENDTEMHAILAEFDLPYHFPKEVIRAAEQISADISDAEIARRRDMRDRTTFTIDPADAKDFDDALSIRPLGKNLWEVGVHIADVTHYVKPGSIIDREAESRATSVYLVDRVVPMLPEHLCNGICSLRPNEEKLAFSCIFEMDENARVINHKITRTVIKSNRRFTYEEAQEIIESGYGEYSQEILTLDRLAKILRKERYENGSVEFNRCEVRFDIDETGHPIGVFFKESKDANKLIEEFMLLANKTVAREIGCVSGKKKAKAFVYRVHDEPDPEKLSELAKLSRTFGYKVKDSGSARDINRSINRMLSELKGKGEENFLSTIAIRSMAKAIYTTVNVGHYGLGFEYYTHFTSPIRRYPDMMVHRLLDKYLNGGRSVNIDKLEDQCKHSSSMEQLAANAERASIKYKQVEFLADHLGEVYDGVISGVTEWGLYVELDSNKCEGMVPIRDLTDDYYEFDEKNYSIVGRHTNTRYRLGDKITIQVARANLDRKQIDFAIIDDRHPRRDEDMLGKNVSVSQAINKPTSKGRGKKNKRR